jgi:hypothetical protein
MIYLVELISSVLYFTSCVYFLFFTEYTLFEGLVIAGILLVVAFCVGEIYFGISIEDDENSRK